MHIPRKRFGQNFLKDANVIGRIADLPFFGPVIEIGPGEGALTRKLLEKHAVTAIEIDRDLAAYLKEDIHNPNFELLLQDALTVDFSQFGAPLRVIGNLPYNITSPLLFHLLNYRTTITYMRFMVQKEVAERMSAQPGTKEYGRLSVMIQACCVTDYRFTVSPHCFYPEPKVDSAIIDLIPHKEQLEPAVFSALEKICKAAFATRRKQLKNNLKAYFDADALSALNINPMVRAEELSVAVFIRLAKAYLENSALQNK